LIQVKLHKPYKLGDSGTGVDPSVSVVTVFVVVSTESVFDASYPFSAVSKQIDDIQ